MAGDRTEGFTPQQKRHDERYPSIAVILSPVPRTGTGADFVELIFSTWRKIDDFAFADQSVRDPSADGASEDAADCSDERIFGRTRLDSRVNRSTCPIQSRSRRLNPRR